jgi:hypothetical protein
MTPRGLEAAAAARLVPPMCDLVLDSVILDASPGCRAGDFPGKVFVNPTTLQ